MKVLHVLASNRYSGAENVVCQIVNMFRNEADIEMAYVSPNGEIANALQERNIKFFALQKLSKKELKKVIKEYQPDVVHAHDMRASFVSALCVGNIKLISHIHNNAFDSRKISLKSIAYLFTGLKAKHIFWVSESSFQGYKFHKFLEKKSSVLYNVIDVDELKNRMEKDKNTYDYDVVYVGRLTYQKNPQRLMKVFFKVVEKQPQAKMAVVGTGELEEETKLLCKELGIEKNVHFLGFQKNPLKIMNDAKVMLMTSRWEGTPMCALEALTLGVPIVSTPVDGLKDLIKNNVNGYLRDNDDEIAEKILGIFQKSNLKECLEREQLKLSINDLNAYKKNLFKRYTEKES